MNASTGYGIISAILFTGMQTSPARFVFGGLALALGILGMLIDLADRVKKNKEEDGGCSVSDTPR